MLSHDSEARHTSSHPSLPSRSSRTHKCRLDRINLVQYTPQYNSGRTACLILLATLLDSGLLTLGRVVGVPGIEVDLGFLDLLVVVPLVKHASHVEVISVASRDGGRRDERDYGRKEVEPHGGYWSCCSG